MDSGALRVFKAVMDHGGVSRAAEALNTVPSNVTTRLKRLEDELGTPLFVRRGRGMEPTPAGTLLHGYAARVLHLLEEAGRAVAGQQHPRALVVGTMETTAAVRLPAVLARFHRSFPGVELTLIPGPTEHLVRELLAWRLDCAFVGGHVEHAGLRAEPAFEEELVLARPARDAPGAERCLLVFRRGCSYRARTETWARERGYLPLRLMEFGSLDAILGCVGAGMGVTVLPRSVVSREPWAGALAVEPLPRDLARMTTWFLYRRGDSPDSTLEGLLACATSALSDERAACPSLIREPGTIRPMLNRIKALLLDEQPPEPISRTDQAHLAAAALLVEAARMDDAIGADERSHIKDIVRRRFSLEEEEARTLFELAEAETQGPAQWHRFTSTLKDRFDDRERIEMIEMLWEVAYADGYLHDLEASLLRRVGGLLYVSDRDRGAARKRVLDRMGISDPATGV